MAAEVAAVGPPPGSPSDVAVSAAVAAVPADQGKADPERVLVGQIRVRGQN